MAAPLKYATPHARRLVQRAMKHGGWTTTIHDPLPGAKPTDWRVISLRHEDIVLFLKSYGKNGCIVFRYYPETNTAEPVSQWLARQMIVRKI